MFAEKPDLAVALERIREAAPARDAEDDASLTREIGWLHEAGALVGALPESLTGRPSWSDDPRAVADVLRSVGRASLPVGRLFEGHVNAAQLIGLYGECALFEHSVRRVKAGRLLGVWGADGPDPVQAAPFAEGFRLKGAKVFCSGLGVVGTAVVSAALRGEVNLFAVDVTEESRADPSQWRVSGMRATRSGGYDFNRMEVAASQRLGGPGDYYVEPYFLGGMYRICAVQAGGLEALMDALAASLRRRPRASEFMSQHRVGAVASRVSTAIAVTDQLARALVAGCEPRLMAREAVLGREAVERCAVEALEIVERAVGTEAHREATLVSLIRRDLSFYIRQAAVDERLAEVGRQFLNPSAS